MDNYERICQIGKGNFGSIFKILRKSDSKVMVWKELDYSRMTEKEKQQIVTEVNIIRELKHPNIVRYYDRILDKKNSKIYIIMEYCEGGDLGQIIKRCKKTADYIQEDIIWKIFTQMVLALNACHSRTEGKILHRDIKPSNVFLDNENNIKLGDFGLSRMLSNESNFAYSHVGTPYYMSPEQIDELRYDDRSDIWSLGCFLYELTSFSPPFQARNHLELAMKIKAGKIEKIPSRYSEELWRVIVWMMDIQQKNRPSIEDLTNLPQVVLRLRERRLKDNFSKIKTIEDNLKKKEEELQMREKQLEYREKALCEKESQLNEKEKALNELNSKMGSMQIHPNIFRSSSSNTLSNAHTNANTNMNSTNGIGNHFGNWVSNDINYTTRVPEDNASKGGFIGSALLNGFQYDNSSQKPRTNRNNDLRQISCEMDNITVNPNRKSFTFKFDPTLYSDKYDLSSQEQQFTINTNNNANREVILTNISTSNKNLQLQRNSKNNHPNQQTTQSGQQTTTSQNIKSRNVSMQKRASTHKMGVSTENIVKTHQRAGSYSSKYVQKSICSINNVIDKSNRNVNNQIRRIHK